MLTSKTNSRRRQTNSTAGAKRTRPNFTTEPKLIKQTECAGCAERIQHANVQNELAPAPNELDRRRQTNSTQFYDRTQTDKTNRMCRLPRKFPAPQRPHVARSQGEFPTRGTERSRTDT